VLGIGAIWMILRRYFKGDFWPFFRRVSGFLVLGGLCVLLGMFIGPVFFSNPSVLMLFLKIVFFVPLVIYLAYLVLKKCKKSGGI